MMFFKYPNNIHIRTEKPADGYKYTWYKKLSLKDSVFTVEHPTI